MPPIFEMNPAQLLVTSRPALIGGSKDGHPLEPKQETTFNFVVQSSAPITTTNLIPKVSFTRIVLTGGKLADPVKDVQISVTSVASCSNPRSCRAAGFATEPRPVNLRSFPTILRSTNHSAWSHAS
jgi:hypothetical protein